MRRVEVEILLTPDAQEEFDEIQMKGPALVRDWALRYLQDLTWFPPEDWIDLRNHLGQDAFKSDNHVPFDIQGLVIQGKTGLPEKVILTRYRARRSS